LEIISGPTISRPPNAPLARLLEIATDDYARVSVSVTDGTESWHHSFHDYALDHSLPLLGFKPDRVYGVEVFVQDLAGNRVSAPDPILLITDPLPSDFAPMRVLRSRPDKMEPGYTLLRPVAPPYLRGYVAVIDNKGEVVWYSGRTSNFGVRRLANGNLLYPLHTQFQEINMLGEVARSWVLPFGMGYHHDAVPTDYGTFLYLSRGSRVVADFPTSATNPDAPRATRRVFANPVRELSLASGEIVNEWFPIDMLNPTRISYLTFTQTAPEGVDWSHANAVIEDSRDGSLIVSMRHQNAVIKFTRSGELRWILGSHDNWGEALQQYLLTPVGEPFEWSFAQHAPMITPQGTLLLYDNGNVRANPFDALVADADNYSRAVEYAIDEEMMTVTQVWEFGKNAPERMFTPAIGDANLLERSGNVLITFGNITHLNGSPPSALAPSASMSRIIEVTHEASPEIVFDLSVFNYEDPPSSPGGYWVYRSYRIPDLYPTIDVSELLDELSVALAGHPSTATRNMSASIAAAESSLTRGNFKATAQQLEALQHKLLAQVGKTDFELAMLFYREAQSIIDMLKDLESPQKDGR